MKKLQELEKEVGHRKGRCGSFVSCITVHEDIPSKEVEKKVFSKPEDYQRMVVFVMDKNSIELIKIVGDGHEIDVTEMGIAGAILLLCITFYIFETPYPNKHNQILGLIQHKIIKDTYAWKKSKRFTELISDMPATSEFDDNNNRKRKAEEKVLKAKGKLTSEVEDDYASDESDNSDENTDNGCNNDSIKVKSKRIRVPKKQIDV